MSTGYYSTFRFGVSFRFGVHAYSYYLLIDFKIKSHVITHFYRSTCCLSVVMVSDLGGGGCYIYRSIPLIGHHPVASVDVILSMDHCCRVGQ